MHLAEGIATGPVLAAGWLTTAAGVTLGLRRLEAEDVPRVGVLSAAFFVASLIHMPVGVTSVHLVLNGLVGVLLGWEAFPALLVALALQAVFFAHGGLTALGVNTATMAAPAVLVGYAVRGWLPAARRERAFKVGFLAGSASILLTGMLLALALFASGRELETVGRLVLVASLPLAGVEGLVTAAVVVFLCQVRPEIFLGGRPAPAPSEEPVP